MGMGILENQLIALLNRSYSSGSSSTNPYDAQQVGINLGHYLEDIGKTRIELGNVISMLRPLLPLFALIDEYGGIDKFVLIMRQILNRIDAFKELFGIQEMKK